MEKPTDPAVTPGTDPAEPGTKGTADPEKTTPEGTGTPSPDEVKSFSQEEVTAIVTKEVSKATRGKVSPDDLGFESAKDMKEALDKMKEDQEAKKTESEKALEEAVAEAKKNAEAGVLSTANARIVKAEFLIAANEAGIPKQALSDAFVLAQAHADWSVEVDAEGVVTGLDQDFFETLKKDKPFLFAEEDKTPGDVGAGAHGEGSTKNRTAELKSKYPALQHLQ